MNALKLIKEDHKTVRGLFRDFDSAGDGALKKKQEIAERACSELEIHAKIEEELLYPAVKASSNEAGEDLVREAIEEHGVVKQLISELQSMSSSDEQFDAKFTVLEENVKHHIQEEEGEMLPRAERQLSKERLESLGEEMRQRKESLQTTLTDRATQIATDVASRVTEAIAGSGTEQNRRPPKSRTTVHRRSGGQGERKTHSAGKR